ncbi:unknownprotein [Zostera marina]|uniref:Uncharacterized protein n=1 Tax=Zostera marina TaxID=29655 RepID=A0A0K9Q4V9_ZOSMR|nr:unknownprotein [Zostera marina]
MMRMSNGFRCLLACVVPCGALDLIRVVHINGQVDEYYKNQMSAGEILRANPNHVLTRQWSQGEGVRRIIVMTPDLVLKRGGIYYLVPAEKLLRAKRIKKSKDATTPEVHGLFSSTKDGVSDKKPVHQRRRSSVGEEIWRPNLQSILEEYDSIKQSNIVTINKP